MKKCILALVAFGAFVPGTAYANEDSPLAGISVGVAVTHDSNKVALPATTISAERRGLGVTGFVGYDAVIANRVLVGVQAEVGTGGRTAGALVGNGIASYFVDPGLTYAATARAGVLASDQLAIYGRMGVRMLRAEILVIDPAGKLAASRTTETGFTYGAGAEFALSEALAVRAEYNRTNFDDGISQNKFLVGGALRF